MGFKDALIVSAATVAGVFIAAGIIVLIAVSMRPPEDKKTASEPAPEDKPS